MSRAALDRLAARHGVTPSYRNMDGSRALVPGETLTRILGNFGLDVRSAESLRAQLETAEDFTPPVLRKVEGARCFLPDWLGRKPAWGVTLQVYELRSRRNWGIGDFADLADVCPLVAQAGADFLGVNPLHALFGADPERCSPFSPSNRLFLNPLYVAPDRLPFFAPEPAEQDQAAWLRETGAVDYRAVAELKLSALRRAFEAWRAGDDAPAPFAPRTFERFRQDGGEPLRRHGLFEALSAHMAAQRHGAGWHGWPEEFRSPENPAVESFAAGKAEEVGFHIWLQWVAKIQLAQAAEAAKSAGMRIGLYLDFAVGEAPDGSATWSEPDLFMPGMSVGAPPDMFTAAGQDWGLAPLSPAALARTEFGRFRAILDALMGSAGALRIDHAMALWQLFFVPGGGVPAEGAYVRYPIETMLSMLAERSLAHEAVVIGEDLGNVPRGFRAVMAAANILSYRILYFEMREGRFIPPRKYPKLALACLSTHDLPTWKGFWRGDDVELRLEHGLIEASAAEAQRPERAMQRRNLIEVLLGCGALAESERAEAEAAQENPSAEPPVSLVLAAHRFVAKTPSLLAGVRLADMVGEERPTNLPGTVESYPNWRLKLPVGIEELSRLELFARIGEAVAEERPKSP
ncbi:MAG TPA: 4-alpha-glucanotransferase [Mesorhizobium sp.]|jgi:4-alpha-glucanotransferase|nr:4-alpha-glucanotransferase [Mesorhizobium sp.]